MKIRILVALLAFTLWSSWTAAAERGTTLTWHGHAAFEVTTPKGRIILIDPWLQNPLNPMVKAKQNPVDHIARADYILITHGHFDHVGDAVAIAKKTGATLVANFELASTLAKLHGYPKEQIGFSTFMNPGGEIRIADGEVFVAMTPAVHSSGLGNPFAKEQDSDFVYGGNPAGFVLRIQNGPTLYHSGDTAYFKDMEVIGEQYTPDVALLNIGGHFGMEADMAAKAAVSVKAKYAIAHHYATFPVLTQDAKGFGEAVKSRQIGFVPMQPGDTLMFEGAQPRLSQH
ncbi:MAG: metal-dependent hydrolase [Nitrospira sp. CR2.1]|nr:metal-dependent hydrolase [Nitrospira sp. CR2.1]